MSDSSTLLLYYAFNLKVIYRANLLVDVIESCIKVSRFCLHQGGHSSGKPGKVRELKSGRGKVRENRKNQGKVRENELLQLFNCREYCSANVSHIYNNSLLRPT